MNTVSYSLFQSSACSCMKLAFCYPLPTPKKCFLLLLYDALNARKKIPICSFFPPPMTDIIQINIRIHCILPGEQLLYLDSSVCCSLQYKCSISSF